MHSSASNVRPRPKAIAAPGNDRARGAAERQSHWIAILGNLWHRFASRFLRWVENWRGLLSKRVLILAVPAALVSEG
jgi:hypothetical protein